jgi:hypothetical protein
MVFGQARPPPYPSTHTPKNHKSLSKMVKLGGNACLGAKYSYSYFLRKVFPFKTLFRASNTTYSGTV